MHEESSRSIVNRRDFLQTSGQLGVGLAAGLMAPHSLPSIATAAEPPAGPAKCLSLSLAAYSFHRSLPRNWPTPRDGNPTMTLEDFIDYCAELKLDGTELTSYYFRRDITPEYLDSLKDRVKSHGMAISGTAIANDFCLPEGDQRQETLATTRMWIDHAARIGAPCIRIFAGNAPKGASETQAIARCARGINESVAYAATKGVILALENHGGITSDPDTMLRIVEQVSPSPFFGINFDSGNLQLEDPYAALEKIAPLAVNAQIKTEMHPHGRKGPAEPADLERIVGILREAGYCRYLVLEYEAAEDPRKAIPRYIDQLRELTS